MKPLSKGHVGISTFCPTYIRGYNYVKSIAWSKKIVSVLIIEGLFFKFVLYQRLHYVILLFSHRYFFPWIICWFSLEDKVDDTATGVGAECETERFELLANHGCPNYRGSAKFPWCDRGTIWKHSSQVEVEGFCAERYVVVSSAYRKLGRGRYAENVGTGSSITNRYGVTDVTCTCTSMHISYCIAYAGHFTMYCLQVPYSWKF